MRRIKELKELKFEAELRPSIIAYFYLGLSETCLTLLLYIFNNFIAERINKLKKSTGNNTYQYICQFKDIKIDNNYVHYKNNYVYINQHVIRKDKEIVLKKSNLVSIDQILKIILIIILTFIFLYFKTSAQFNYAHIFNNKNSTFMISSHQDGIVLPEAGYISEYMTNYTILILRIDNSTEDQLSIQTSSYLSYISNTEYTGEFSDSNQYLEYQFRSFGKKLQILKKIYLQNLLEQMRLYYKQPEAGNSTDSNSNYFYNIANYNSNKYYNIEYKEIFNNMEIYSYFIQAYFLIMLSVIMLKIIKSILFYYWKYRYKVNSNYSSKSYNIPRHPRKSKKIIDILPRNKKKNQNYSKLKINKISENQMSGFNTAINSPISLDNSISNHLNNPQSQSATNEDIMDILKLMKTEANIRNDTQNDNFAKVVNEMGLITTRLNEQNRINSRVDEKLNHLNNQCNGVQVLSDRLELLEKRLTEVETRRPGTGLATDPNKVFKIELRNFPDNSTPDVTINSWGMNVVVNTNNLLKMKLCQDRTLELYCTNGRTKYLIATWLKSNLASLQSQKVSFMPGFLKWIQSEDVKTFEVHNAAKNTVWSHDFQSASGSLN